MPIEIFSAAEGFDIVFEYQPPECKTVATQMRRIVTLFSILLNVLLFEFPITFVSVCLSSSRKHLKHEPLFHLEVNQWHTVHPILKTVKY